MAILLAVVTQ